MKTLRKRISEELEKTPHGHPSRGELIRNRILCAAIHFNDGKIHDGQPFNIRLGFVLCGHRHGSVLCLAYELGLVNEDMNEKAGNAIQGFLTDKNQFVDRKQAAKIAYHAGQLKSKVDILMSEHLY